MANRKKSNQNLYKTLSATDPSGTFFALEVTSNRRYVTLRQDVQDTAGKTVTKAMTFPLEIFEDFLKLDLKQKELLAATGRNADILRSCLDEHIDLIIEASSNPVHFFENYQYEDRHEILEKVIRALASLFIMDNMRRTGTAGVV